MRVARKSQRKVCVEALSNYDSVALCNEFVLYTTLFSSQYS